MREATTEEAIDLENRSSKNGRILSLPRFTTMTLPLSWKKRRMTILEGLRLYYDDISTHMWIDIVPVTDFIRTLDDCSNELALLPFFEQGLEEANVD